MLRCAVQIIGEADLSKVIRLQLALMAPHTQIKIHTDQGRYASHAHRIHVVIATNPKVGGRAMVFWEPVGQLGRQWGGW